MTPRSRLKKPRRSRRREKTDLTLTAIPRPESRCTARVFLCARARREWGRAAGLHVQIHYQIHSSLSVDLVVGLSADKHMDKSEVICPGICPWAFAQPIPCRLFSRPGRSVPFGASFRGQNLCAVFITISLPFFEFWTCKW